MARTCILAVLATCVAVSPAAAQDIHSGWRFRWQNGQVLYYRVDHHTNVSETVSGNKVETTSKLALIKRWEVTAVDVQGVATLKLSVTAMRHEQSRPNGETLLFDSAKPDKSTPELREQMGKFIGQTLAVLRVDPMGRVVAVQQGSAAKYESEPPFVVRLPGKAVTVNQAWERTYEVTLEPPLGAGEKFAASQRYHLTKADDQLATVRLTTQFKNQPESVADRIPLLQNQPEGEIVFNIAAGRLESANLRIDQQLDGHQGEGSSYHFTSTYREVYVPSQTKQQ
jgi:hypothetical protein